MSHNSITGDALRSRPATKEYMDNYDRIFGKGEKMGDADMAYPGIETVIDEGVKRAMQRASEIPPGNPGECDGCSELYGRLVDGYCSPCRDRYAKYIK